MQTDGLTNKEPIKFVAEYSQILYFFTIFFSRENKAGHFMWIIC